MLDFIVLAQSENEYFDDEYDPRAFVIHMNPKRLADFRSKLKAVRKILIEEPGLRSATFDCDYGVWAKADEVLDERATNDWVMIDAMKDDFIFNECEYVEVLRVIVEPDGDIWFRCYGKYSGNAFWTPMINIEEFEKLFPKDKPSLIGILGEDGNPHIV